jgi:hypothetical protein
MSAPTQPSHSWKFVRTGGLDQVSLESAADLRALSELDQKLWVALSCPVKGLQIDERTLALIDTDGDGHVRPPEVIAAVSWACARLKDPATLFHSSDTLKLETIGGSPEGAAVAESAAWILSKTGKQGSVSAADAAELWPSRFRRAPEGRRDPEARGRCGRRDARPYQGYHGVLRRGDREDRPSLLFRPRGLQVVVAGGWLNGPVRARARGGRRICRGGGRPRQGGGLFCAGSPRGL